MKLNLYFGQLVTYKSRCSILQLDLQLILKMIWYKYQIKRMSIFWNT